MSNLEVRIQDKRFNGKTILRDLEFAAQQGESLALVGPSGAGKSTLLNLISGLDDNFTGSVSWDGAPLYHPGESPQQLGMMFQEPRLMPWLSVLDNVRLVSQSRDSKRARNESQVTARATSLLREVGLGDNLDAWPGQLSGGMQRRVALARAFMISPRLLLLDEPFVSLDMPTGNRLRESLLRLCRRARPLVLYVTHDLREALAIADRVLFLSPSPARVILDYRVDLAQPRQLEGNDIARLQTQLFACYPDLLSGLLDSPSPG